MKSIYRLGLGVAAGLAIGYGYLSSLPERDALVLNPIEMKPYAETSGYVENHRGRKGLDFRKSTFFYKDREDSEIALCYEGGSDYPSMFVFKGNEGSRSEKFVKEPCSECHPLSKKRLPLPPNARTESG